MVRAARVVLRSGEQPIPKPVTDLIRRRHSTRAYVREPISEDARRALLAFLLANTDGPLGSRVRFELLAATAESRDSLRGLGTYGFVRGAQAFIAGAVGEAPKDLEDYGYLMERAVLRATDLGLGTCWLGGTFSKSGFARGIGLGAGEQLPAVVAVGYPVPGCETKDPLRRFASSASRLPGEELFFDGRWGIPLTAESAAAYGEVLEAVRWAPSASNKQPWRIVRSGDDWHFFLRRSRGYRSKSRLVCLVGIADLQRVDMGIAMCHFGSTADELRLGGRWRLDGRGVAASEGEAEYTVTWGAT